MKKTLALLLALMLVLSCFAGCGAAEEAAPAEEAAEEVVEEVAEEAEEAPAVSANLTMGTGGESGTYYAFGGVLASYISTNTGIAVNVVSTGGTTANIAGIDEGTYDLATVQSDVSTYAYMGTNSFEETGAVTSFSVLGALYAETVQIVTCDPEITSVADLEGKSVCVGDVGSGTYYNTVDVLAAYGLTIDDITPVYQSFGDSTESIKDGKIDAAFTVAGAPTTAIVDYATTNELNLVSLSADELAKVTAEYPFLVQDDLAAGTYSGQDDVVTCVAVQAALVADKTVSEDVVYELTKAIYENQADLTAGHAKWGLLSLKTALDNTAPMHPGAEKYYKEVGAL